MSTLSWWRRWSIRRNFNRISGPDRLIDYAEWKSVQGSRQDVISRRAFALIDTDGSGYIDFDEYLKFAEMLYSTDRTLVLGYIFRTYDSNNDGKLDRAEVESILQATLSEQSLRLSNSVVKDLTDALLFSIVGKRKVSINQEDFISASIEFPGIEQHLDNFTEDWTNYGRRIKTTADKATIISADIFHRLKRRIQANWLAYLWGAALLALNVYLFLHAMSRYAASGHSLAVQIARGGGACLNLNSAIIVLPMCRALITGLNASFFSKLVPLNDPVKFHKIIAYSVVLFSIVHIAAHTTNYILTHQSLVDALFYNLTGLTGVVATLILTLLVWSNARWKKKSHQLFSLAHYSYAVFIVACLYHGPVFWAWLTIPLLLFFVDALIRTFSKTRKLVITKLTALSDRVTTIRLNKPDRFNFRPGDYLWLNIPELSRWQWHPFTISAAPENNHINLHIKSAGDWSGALNNLACKKDITIKNLPAVIDGPYGAPASHIGKSRIAILVAGGIGVTPFASVMQSLLIKDKRARSKHLKSNQIIYFHWLNRSHKSYDWFVSMLAEAESQLGSDRFSLYIHLTTLSHDLTNLLMQMALEAYHKKHNLDPITGLKAITSAGRPDWDQLFGEVSMRHGKERVDLYFCGPKPLGDMVKKMCLKYGFIYRAEKF